MLDVHNFLLPLMLEQSLIYESLDSEIQLFTHIFGGLLLERLLSSSFDLTHVTTSCTLQSSLIVILLGSIFVVPIVLCKLLMLTRSYTHVILHVQYCHLSFSLLHYIFHNFSYFSTLSFSFIFKACSSVVVN